MIFTIGDCSIDTGAYEIRRNGERVPVEPQVFDLLVLLLENGERLVTKKEISHRIWNGRIVSEAALSSRIKTIRQVIGDDGKSQGLIRTVRGRGFRVVGAIGRSDAPDPSPLAAGEQIEHAAQSLGSRAKAHLSCVRIAVPSGFVNILTPHLPKFRKAHPHLILEFLSGSKKVDLLKGDADLALRAGPPEEDLLMTRMAGEIEWSLYASPDYLAGNPYLPNARDLSGHKLIGFDKRLSATPAAKWLADRSRGASIEVRHHEVVDMVSSAANGIGIAILPCVYGNQEARLKRLTGDVLARTPISLVYRRDAARSESVRAAMNFVIEALRPRK
jgi:DNA-binding transcriptional LysR family regulator